VALLVDPRVVVVGDPQSVETRGLRTLGLVDEREGSVLLTGKGKTDLHTAVAFPATRAGTRETALRRWPRAGARRVLGM
jgi:hypothetical protein